MFLWFKYPTDFVIEIRLISNEFCLQIDKLTLEMKKKNKADFGLKRYKIAVLERRYLGKEKLVT